MKNVVLVFGTIFFIMRQEEEVWVENVWNALLKETNGRCVHEAVVSDRLLQHTIIQTKWSKSLPRFRPDRLKNHILWLHTYFM